MLYVRGLCGGLLEKKKIVLLYSHYCYWFLSKWVPFRFVCCVAIVTAGVAKPIFFSRVTEQFLFQANRRRKRKKNGTKRTNERKKKPNRQEIIWSIPITKHLGLIK